MKRLILALVLLLALASTGLAAENLTGLAMDGKQVMVRNGFSFTPYAVTGNSTIADESFLAVNHTDVCTINYTPAVGQMFVVSQIGADTDAATVLLPSGLTWNGTNRGAVFSAAAKTLVCIRVSATRVVILENLGTVGFSN
jgi:hypothetical protein